MRVLQLQTLMGILAQHDPEGLLLRDPAAPLGAPPDEYEPEAQALVCELVPVTSREECLAVVERVWQQYFTRITPSCRHRLQSVAKDIWHLSGDLPS
jgi:hypothetical protein